MIKVRDFKAQCIAALKKKSDQRKVDENEK
jgi:hypothetical protein